MTFASFARTSISAAAIIASLALTACGHKAPVSVANSNPAAAPAAGATVLAPTGTVFYGKLNTAIGTKTSKSGDTFTLTAADSFMHKNNAALEGAVVDGHLDNVVAAELAKKPGMTVAFDDVTLADGSKVPVSVAIVSMNEFEPKTHHLRTLGMMAGGAIAGHMAAAKMGKKHGSLVGAAGAYVLSQELKTDIAVPAGTVVELKLTAPLTSAAATQAPQ